MYKRFTDGARCVMQLANQEAQRFNHEYVDTAHILLGLVKEGSGVAANVLKNLDIDLRKIRIETEKLVKDGRFGMFVELGPDMVTMDKLPLTPRSARTVEWAIKESQLLGHSYQGTEHLLLGLLRDPECLACTVLNRLGVTLESVRKGVMTIIGPPWEIKADDWVASADNAEPEEPILQQLERLKQGIVTEIFTNLLSDGLDGLAKMKRDLSELGHERNLLASAVLQVRNVVAANLDPADALRRIEKVLKELP